MKKYVLLSALLLISCGADEKPRTNDSVAVLETATSENAKTQPSLGLTPMQFKQQFNNASLMTDGSTFEIHAINVKHGDVFDTALLALSNNNNMIISVTKSGLVNSVTTISNGDGTLKSGADMLYLSAVLARSIHPNLDMQVAGKIGVDLFTQSGDAGGKPVTKVVNGVKHFATFSKELGYWYGVETAENN